MSMYKIVKQDGVDICIIDTSIVGNRGIPIPKEGEIPNSYYIDYLQWIAKGNTPDIEEVVVDPQIAVKTQERMSLENEYLQCSRQICLWAGDELADGVYPKLEDVDFKAKAQLAVTAVGNPANMLLTFMNYCFLQLKFGYNWTFEQIEYRDI